MHKSGWLSRTDGWFGYSENLGLSSLKYMGKPSDPSAVLSPFYLSHLGRDLPHKLGEALLLTMSLTVVKGTNLPSLRSAELWVYKKNKK